MDVSPAMGQLVEYVVTCAAPLALAQLTIRPLSGRPLVPQLLCDLRPKDLIFSRSTAYKEGKWWTPLTTMLVHWDGDHLRNNLQAMVFAGWPVFRSFGAFPVFASFFGGGVFAAFDPLNLRTLQLERNFAASWQIPDSLPFSDWVNGKTERMAKWTVSSFLQEHRQYVGSSAGNFALFGMQSCLAIEQITAIVRSGRFEYAEMADIWNCVSFLINASGIAQRELASITSGGQGIVTTDHASHLSGLLFGVACYWAFTLARTTHRHFRSSSNNQGYRLGDR